MTTTVTIHPAWLARAGVGDVVRALLADGMVPGNVPRSGYLHAWGRHTEYERDRTETMVHEWFNNVRV